MGSSPFRVPNKPHIHMLYGYWWLRRAPYCPMCAKTVPDLTKRLAIGK